ncbi:MAG TPA: SCO family protein [Acidimicrobiales bacterium]|jgi:protein SCO1/2
MRHPRARARRALIIALLIALLGGAALAAGYALRVDRTYVATTNAGPIDRVAYRVPPRIAHLALLTQRGRTTDLAAFRGRILVFADFMTSCQEECPITTAALEDVRHSLLDQHLSSKVAIVEVSVDPERDRPSRLLAYARRFGVSFSLLTGSPAHLRELWKYLGVYYQRVKEGTPPDINWQTGRPYTYDIVHTDDVFILGPSGQGAAIAQSNADTGGKIPAALASLLDGEGRSDLVHPGQGSWTPAEMVRALDALVPR